MGAMDKNIDKNKEVLTNYMNELASELKKKKGIPTQKVFKALQQQHLVGKILKEHDILNQRNILDDVDLLRACQLGIKGLDGYREDVADNLIKLLKNMNLKNYKNVVSPLGNYIMGFKTVKEYCPKYLRPNQLKTAQKYYTEMKLMNQQLI